MFVVSATPSQKVSNDEGQEQNSPSALQSNSNVAFILLTEAHVAMPVSLCHAGMIDHEEVHLEVVSAGSFNLIMLRPDELNNFDTAAITRRGGGHVILRVGPVPGVMAPWVLPGVAVKAINLVSSHAVTAGSKASWGEDTQDDPCQRGLESLHHVALEDSSTEHCVLFRPQ